MLRHVFLQRNKKNIHAGPWNASSDTHETRGVVNVAPQWNKCCMSQVGQSYQNGLNLFPI